MAYRDENGKITIDEQAAAKDVKRIQNAVQVLSDSREAIRSLQRQAGNMQGLTANAIIDKAVQMDKKLSAMIDKLEETISFVNKTVRHYERIDEQLKQIIQNSVSVADTPAKPVIVPIGHIHSEVEVVPICADPTKIADNVSEDSVFDDIGDALDAVGKKVKKLWDDIF